MKGDLICYNGEIVATKEPAADIDALLSGNFIYQRINTLEHVGLHFATIYQIANNSYETLYGHKFGTKSREIESGIKSLLEDNRYPLSSNLVTWYLLPPDSDNSPKYILSATEQLLYTGYQTWHSRLNTISLSYEYPFSSHKSAVSMAAHRFAQWYAHSNGADAALTQSYENTLISAGENPLFAVAGQQIITPPLECGAADSIERRLGIVASEDSGLQLYEQAISSTELLQYDELFTVLPQGVVSIKSCNGTLFPNTMANKIGAAMSRFTTEELVF